MKILVLGGTGGVGRHVVDQAVTAGHDGPLRTDYVEDREGASSGGFSVARATVAHLMLKAVSDPAYEGVSVAVGNPKK
ncbi:hypothetical protein IEQ44_07415 [Nocardioides sp. Y6]|uniref:NAD-dependent epimerase/dehydratase family protein n=1 Tax=Nocardioides malaquae TaxID=2773426 RepID=A0ABR9RSD3_9ACTN|nr:hypothetical protein [Nocardioides malaquae]MBE7324478.1 hypothetical protein [Nocardioides malaquae]